MKASRFALLFSTVLVGACVLTGCNSSPPDEAKAAGKSPLDFPAASHDFFADMDMAADASGKLRRLDLTIDEIKGRNTWVMWCGGNEAFWDWLSSHSYGFLDLLKLVASPDYDTAIGKRKDRFSETGMMNEPGFAAAKEKDEFGLFIDIPHDGKLAKPREDVYGRSSGVVGLRLFKNPNFDEAARRHWDAKKYFTDAKYYNDPTLVRPYRVGMSCGFCHVAPHPLSPPKDPAEPEWANLSSNIGNQYWRARAIFGGLLKPDNFVYHVLDAQPPGTIDTSLVASDNINNPNTMNAVFEVPARLDRSGINWHRTDEWKKKNEEWWKKSKSWNLPEKQSDPSLTMPVLLEYPGNKDNPRLTPRILLDGSDSVGAWGALARVYLNIGTYHQEWVRLHNTIIGGKAQEPFKIATCDENSVYWQANKLRVEYLAKFFLKSTAPMRLKDAPGGAKYLKEVGRARGGKAIVAGEPWHAELKSGRKVFAQRCIVCHSSKQPELFQDFAAQERGPKEKQKWKTLLDLLDDPAYQAWSLQAVEDKDFWADNLLSTDHRVPISLLRTNAGRALATNAIKGHVWEEFASEDYRALPAVEMTYFDPYEKDEKKKDKTMKAPGGGRGYYRPASLVAIWATAPYLHNNSVGIFTNDPSVEGRMKAFDDGIAKLLVRASTTKEAADKKLSREELFRRAAENRWQMGSDLNGSTKERLATDHGLIWRTPAETTLRIPAGYLPNVVSNATAFEFSILNKRPWLIPAGLLLLALIALLSSDCDDDWRYLGYGLIVIVTLGILFGVYFILRRVADEWFTINPDLLTIGFLILVGAVILFVGFFYPKRFLRKLGYAYIVLSVLVAFVSYFFAGRLGDLHLGPIPRNTPVNLLANLGPDPETGKFEPQQIDVIKTAVKEMRRASRAKTEAERQDIHNKVAESLLSISRCRDLVMDRGHYFAAALSEDELRDLIDLIKTF